MLKRTFQLQYIMESFSLVGMDVIKILLNYVIL